MMDCYSNFVDSLKCMIWFVICHYYGLGITGDGRCLFRSVAHGAYLRSGKPSPSEHLQKQLADELRSKVVDEFIKRFLEGDFETYISQMRLPYVWGGEPELLMCSHVLEMPITVYMCNQNSDSFKIIAEYGQEYGKDNPIRVLYHSYGHYEALQIPVTRTSSKGYSKR
ncbi:OVARIAN TUMOR DOMAIN-containing deubiquitinating enzyme 4-like isoform X2 [Dioscorea cayenensis subsp. rotundata]|uniref:Ubiquitin thioesterase OTU n=1 Tax=Dioscorea cayennensis subsp. rotundata TaxID=55577 RepID=A0AB40BDM4_DIOCR|nr:OVARIAN TUMOR DOMAIN-containing deubiquitinating enzyme 4-like isoform X2 [Dioscorea cayenensis subsp. rotundata]